MKPYVIFKDSKTIYKLNDSGFYECINNPNNGFNQCDVVRFKNQFIEANDFEEANQKLKEYAFSKKYGPRKKNCDVHTVCPKCGYEYTFDYMDINEGYYTIAIKDDFTENIKCICGCHFEAKIEVIVKFHTKILDN